MCSLWWLRVILSCCSYDAHHPVSFGRMRLLREVIYQLKLQGATWHRRAQKAFLSPLPRNDLFNRFTISPPHTFSQSPLTPATRPTHPANVSSFSERFPLSPELWQEWIDDRRAAGGEDALEDVLRLYERAFADYQCAKLWPGYLETLEESLDVSPWLVKLRAALSLEYALRLPPTWR